MTLERLGSQRHVKAMLALDTADAIFDRVVRLVTSGRRMSMTHSYPNTEHHVELTAGLMLHGEPQRAERDGARGLTVHMRPGTAAGFSLWATADGESDTERQVWDRFHGPPDGRVNMVEVTLTGGLPDTSPARDDVIITRHYNSARVCIERVIAFDQTEVAAEAEDMMGVPAGWHDVAGDLPGWVVQKLAATLPERRADAYAWVDLGRKLGFTEAAARAGKDQT